MYEHLIQDGHEQGHKAVIIHPEAAKFLVVRSVRVLPGQLVPGWDIPGGRQEVGETPEETLLREIGEEAPGYRVDINRAINLGTQLIARSYAPDVLRRVWMLPADNILRHRSTRWLNLGTSPDNLDPLLQNFMQDNADHIKTSYNQLRAT